MDFKWLAVYNKYKTKSTWFSQPYLFLFFLSCYYSVSRILSVSIRSISSAEPQKTRELRVKNTRQSITWFFSVILCLRKKNWITLKFIINQWKMFKWSIPRLQKRIYIIVLNCIHMTIIIIHTKLKYLER